MMCGVMGPAEHLAHGEISNVTVGEGNGGVLTSIFCNGQLIICGRVLQKPCSKTISDAGSFFKHSVHPIYAL
jgi:hypothetical protein